MATEDRTANVVLTADTGAYAQQMTQAATQTNQVTDSVNKLLESLDKASKTTGKGLVIVSAASVAGITAATVAAGRFEQQLSTLEARATAAGQAFKPMQRDIDQLRRDLPVTTQQVTALSEALTKMGTNPSQLKETARTLIELSGASGEDLGQLATGMTQLQRSMGTGVQGMRQYSDLLLNLSTGMGTSASATLQFANQIAPVGRTLKMSQQEVMGFSAAFAKSGEDGFRAANVFNTMLTDISQASRYGTKDLSMYASLIGKTREEFQNMDSASQVVEIFEAINKQGDGAVKTLERMGFDGARAMKSIQSVVQSGSIAEAMGISSDPSKQNGDTLAKASEEAFDGLSDSAQKLQNNVTSLSQSFGATFLPVLQSVTDAATRMTSVLNSALQPFMPILGVGAGVATAGIGAAGGAIQALGPMAMAAGGYALFRNSFGAGRAVGSGRRDIPGTYSRAGARFDAGGGSPVGRMLYAAGLGTRGAGLREGAGRGEERMYRAGRVLGQMSPRGMILSFAEKSPLIKDVMEKGGNRGGSLRNFGGRMSMLAAAGVTGVINASSQSFDPLRPGAVHNLANRGVGGWDTTKQAWQGFRSGEGGLGASTRLVSTSMGQFARTVAGATVGLTKLGAAAGMAAARGIGSAVGSAAGGIGRGIMGLAGGPMGLAVMGGMAAYGIYSSANAGADEFSNRVGDDDGASVAYNTYATKLGLAGVAVSAFASTVETAAEKIASSTNGGRDWGETEGDTLLGRDYTNENIGGMNEAEVITFLSSLMSNSSADPRVLAEAQLDVRQAFGDEIGKSIWESAKDAPIDYSSLLTGKMESSGLGNIDMWNSTEKYEDALDTAVDTYKATQSEIRTRGEGEQSEIANTVAAVNSLVTELGVAGSGNPGDRHRIERSIEEVLGLSPEESNFDAWKAKDDLTTVEGVARATSRILAQNDSITSEQYDALSDEQKRSTSYGFRPYAERRDEADALKMRSTMAGEVLWGQTTLGNNIRTAASLEGNENANLYGGRQFAEKVMSLTDSASDATLELQNLKSSTGDLENSWSLIATSAQAFVAKINALNLTGATTSERQQVNISNLAGAIKAGSTDEQASQIEAARDALMADYQEYDSRVRSMAKASRSFNQSQEWARESYGISRGRQVSAFGRQMSRQEQDRERSIDYSVEDFYRQRSQSVEDFNRQRSRSDEDYNRQRDRSDDNYDRQRERSLFDFNLSREQSEYDFNLSRSRQEDDFNHQREMMAKRTASSMADIYSRINVQQTWDAQNLVMNMGEQATLFSQQIENLKKLRAMGISSDTIKILGLNDPRNAQQVARMVQDLQNAPDLVGQFNQAASDRLDLAEMFAFDEDNEAWTEMERSFNLAAERAEEDFDRMAERGAEAFQRSMDRMSEDYERSMNQMDADYKRSNDRAAADFERSLKRNDENFSRSMKRQDEMYDIQNERAREDFGRSLSQMDSDFERQMRQSAVMFNQQFEEVTGGLNDLADEVMSNLSGTAADQFSAMHTNFKEMGKLIEEDGLSISEAFEKVFVDPYESFWMGGKSWSGNSGAMGGQFLARGDGHDDHWGGNYKPSDFLSGGGAHNPMPSGYGPGMGALQKYGAPRDGGRRKHEGTDFPAPTGTPIYAAMGGKASTMYSRTGGNVTVIDHGNGLFTKYLHQSTYSIGNGDVVAGGQMIGKVGNTGSASRGAHLHFEVRQGGTFGPSMDPVSWLGAAINGSSNGGTTDGGGFMTEENKRNWLGYVKDEMKDIEGSLASSAYMRHLMPSGYATAGTQDTTMTALNNMGFLAHGAIFDRTNSYTVGERGSELLIPLDHRGSDYLADTMSKYAKRVDQKAQGHERVAAMNTTTYNQSYDASVNFSGDVHVESPDPMEMARKLEEQARLKRLTTR